jgi:hypothetical protein
MKFRILTIVAICACALVCLPVFVPPANAASKPAPKPTPVGLQYDEISRMVIAPATPPPPGSFTLAYNALVAAEQNQTAQNEAPKRHGLAGLLSGISNVGQQMQQTATQMQNMMQYGVLTRIAYYNGWIRTDDVVDQTAVIDKCQQHQAIHLNLAKKTYSIVDTQGNPRAACVNPPMPSTPGNPQVVNEAPGTVDLNVTSSAKNLGPMTIEGVPTNGSQMAVAMSMTNATGSCKNGEFGMQTTQYVSNITPPRRFCPLPKVGGIPTTPAEMVVRGGCKPTIHGSASGMASMGTSGNHLAMYALMQMTSGQGAGKFSSLTQAGNVKWLMKPEAEALFSVPADYAQEQH